MSEPKVHPKKLRLSKETLRQLEKGPTQLMTTIGDSIQTFCFLCPTTPSP